jgi:hypothetical protein
MIGEIRIGVTEYTVCCFMCLDTDKAHWYTKAKAEEQFRGARWFTVSGLWTCPAHSRTEALAELRKRRHSVR